MSSAGLSSDLMPWLLFFSFASSESSTVRSRPTVVLSVYMGILCTFNYTALGMYPVILAVMKIMRPMVPIRIMPSPVILIAAEYSFFAGFFVIFRTRMCSCILLFRFSFIGFTVSFLETFAFLF